MLLPREFGAISSFINPLLKYHDVLYRIDNEFFWLHPSRGDIAQYSLIILNNL